MRWILYYPFQPPDKGTTVRRGILRAGTIFSSTIAVGQTHLVALTPFVPLSRLAGEGEDAAPLSHPVGEGLGVRAKKRTHSACSEPKRCTLTSAQPPPWTGEEPRLPLRSRGGLGWGRNV